MSTYTAVMEPIGYGDDGDLVLLDRLVNEAGHDQRQASLALWTDDPVPTDVARDLASLRARLSVRLGYSRAFPWLRLPTPRPWPRRGAPTWTG